MDRLVLRSGGPREYERVMGHDDPFPDSGAIAPEQTRAFTERPGSE